MTDEIKNLKATIFDLILTRDEYLAKAKYMSDEIQRLMMKLKEIEKEKEEEYGNNKNAGISPI